MAYIDLHKFQGVTCFESRQGYPLCLLRFLVVFFSPSRPKIEQILGYVPAAFSQIKFTSTVYGAFLNDLWSVIQDFVS